MNLTWIQQCRICGNPHLEEVMDFGMMPNQGSFDYKDNPAPVRRLLPNKILRCNTQKQKNGCGLIQNAVNVDPRILYANYGYSSSVAASMRQHLASIVEKTKKFHFFYEDVVVDVGANSGELLSNIPADSVKVAIDPSDIVRTISDKHVEIYNECFPSCSLTNKYRGRVDVLFMIACFYDVVDFNSYFNHFNAIMKDSGIAVFEVAYLPSVLSSMAYDQFVIEHAVTFSLSTLENLFNHHGWVIYNAEKTPTNGGSLLFYVCRKGNPVFDTKKNNDSLNDLRFEEFDMALDDPATYVNFKSKIQKHAADLKELLVHFKRRDKNIHIYGASTKLNLVLGYANIGPDLIDCAAERDPKKWGGKLLNGIPMVPEEQSRKTVDMYLVGPWHFAEEIRTREWDFVYSRRSTKPVEFIFPLPEIVRWG